MHPLIDSASYKKCTTARFGSSILLIQYIQRSICTKKFTKYFLFWYPSVNSISIPETLRPTLKYSKASPPAHRLSYKRK